MKNAINYLLSYLDLTLRRKSVLNKQISSNISKVKREHDVKICGLLSVKHGTDLSPLVLKSKSQRLQDIFALSELDFKHGGFFVEFGASDGVTLSNTFLLEKDFGYSGILSEPNPSQRRNIYLTRSAKIEEKCVWRKSGEVLTFSDLGDLSTITRFSEGSVYSKSLEKASKFDVQTISLTDMLEKHAAPNLIDYLSVDTEGSEYEILAAHDFSKYIFRVITIEHNYSENREKLHKLLSPLGYERKYCHLSDHEDWYVLR